MNTEEIGAVLALEPLGRLGLVDEGRPYVIPIPFLYHQNHIYMAFRLWGRKHIAALKNPQVCFEVDWTSRDMEDFASVLLEGTLDRVEDPEEKEVALLGLKEKYKSRKGHGGLKRILALDENASLCRLTVEKVSGLTAEGESLAWVALASG